jgi:SAM-dependent methyltransferase
LVCERLDGGTITAIDRSPRMIAMAERRNRRHVESGAARFLLIALAGADLPEASVDVAFAVHVDLFRRDSSRELAVVRRALAPGGRLWLFMHPPTAAGVDDFAARAAAGLPAAGFRIERTLREDVAGRAAVAVAAVP